MNGSCPLDHSSSPTLEGAIILLRLLKNGFSVSPVCSVLTCLSPLYPRHIRDIQERCLLRTISPPFVKGGKSSNYICVYPHLTTCLQSLLDPLPFVDPRNTLQIQIKNRTQCKSRAQTLINFPHVSGLFREQSRWVRVVRKT